MTKLIELLTETLNSLEVGEGIDDLGTGIGNLKAAIAIINDASRVKQETADPAAILGQPCHSIPPVTRCFPWTKTP